MLDREIARLLEGAPPPPTLLTPATIAALRAGMAQAGALLTGAPLHQVCDLDADGVPVRLYRPSSDPALPLLVFLHGGGWFLGDLDSHDAMHRHLAARAGCAVLAVGYRLSPEHRHPAALDDAVAALRWAQAQAVTFGCDPARVALGGESAGGHLAAALTLRLRDGGDAQPLFQLLVHPVTDLRLPSSSLDTLGSPGPSRAFLEVCRTLYAGDADLDDPLVSPMRAARHDGLAPAIVLTAAEDPLRDDGELYAATLAAAGVETLARRLPGLPHGFLFLPATVPAVANAFDLIASLLRRYFQAT